MKVSILYLSEIFPLANYDEFNSHIVVLRAFLGLELPQRDCR